ncbi:hypothetical protein OsI_33048 [Oryza sativa Indica Group]|uniref:BLE2 protein n=1 Tax=Oryza sativa subsp. indica TaxID=39946 RepID=B8BG62_ORYSI|nr:hypothetical protein OsI_33048 [Oryza sativa Indica Group]
MARPSPVEASGGPVMGDITGGGGELRVQIAANSGGQGGKVVGAAPEKCLNRFVRVVALMERTGNALGTLAFTWATVILLGGYPTKLHSKDDFAFATIIVFLEAASHPNPTETPHKEGEELKKGEGADRQRGRRPITASSLCTAASPMSTDTGPATPNLANAQGLQHYHRQASQPAAVATTCSRLSKGDGRGRYMCCIHTVTWQLTDSSRIRACILAGLRLEPEGYNGEGDTANLFTSLQIFYGMVFAQGLLYVFAGMVEFLFSFITRRSLVRHGGFTGQWGVESVDLYYEYAFSKYMKGGLFAPERISLSNFAIDSLNSDLSKNQLYGVWMMHIFLQRHPTREQLLEKLNTSAQTMARLISMLDWTRRNEHPTIRLYAAKVVAELAKSLRVVIVPGAMQLVSTLLDTDGKPEKGHPLLDADDYQDPFVDTTVKQEKRQDATGHHQGKTQETLGDTDRLLETPNRSTRTNAQTSILRCWRKISAYWSIPKEQPLTDNDLLPALGMSIVYNLVGCDQNNLLEIDRVTDLIPKITGFTSFRSAIMNSESQQKVLLKSSLKVLQRLTRIEGEIGITLRYKISKHPFLFRNLAEILGDSSSNQELRKLVAGILRNLAIDRDIRQEIGQMQMLITMLMKAFLDSSRSFSSNVDCLLPKVAGQALVMLSSENPHNCFVMLKEPDFINKLKNMILIHDDKYIYVAVSLLRNMCLHAQPELTESDLKKLSHTLGEVLERIMDAEGAELEILIGLSSQICKLIPEEFSQKLEHGQIKRRFIKRLVDTLNANMNPSSHCPGIRRVVLEQSIYMMEYNSHYANCFNEYQMMDALSIVELTPSRAENYMVFLGDTGFMECNTPLSALADRAKELMGRQWLQGINSAN